MNYILIDHLIWETSKMAKGKEKADFNGIMDKFMMENGKVGKNMEAEYGKIQMDYHMLGNGGET